LAERSRSGYQFIRPLLFRLDAERAHALTIQLLCLVGALPPVGKLLHASYAGPDQPVKAFGLNFANPVGLAAGYDKDGLGWRGLASLGFGHIEVGTVTLLPQAGNPPPRLFRLVEETGLINRMGFPGKGVEFVAHSLAGKRPAGLVLGANLGKNRQTPLEEAARDYLGLMERLAPLVDYLAINVSSPNTIGLRRLQGRQALESLTTSLMVKRAEILDTLNRPLPLLVKLAPDLDDAELDDALDVLLRAGVQGVIATNTTLSRDGVTPPHQNEAGGLSGAPLRRRSTHVVHEISRRTGGLLPIIAAGGIMNADDAKEKLDAGALLVQIYTGLVYAGPGLVKTILAALAER
jgi:dihydroorotate dehydrogenase